MLSFEPRFSIQKLFYRWAMAVKPQVTSACEWIVLLTSSRVPNIRRAGIFLRCYSVVGQIIAAGRTEFIFPEEAQVRLYQSLVSQSSLLLEIGKTLVSESEPPGTCTFSSISAPAFSWNSFVYNYVCTCVVIKCCQHLDGCLLPVLSFPLK